MDNQIEGWKQVPKYEVGMEEDGYFLFGLGDPEKKRYLFSTMEEKYPQETLQSDHHIGVLENNKV